jgi:hypothetical protein
MLSGRSIVRCKPHLQRNEKTGKEKSRIKKGNE